MNESIAVTLPLARWQGDRGTYHLVTLTGEAAEQVAMHARIERLETGTRRGFGSVKVVARIGDTRWRTSLFPQRRQSEWVLLVGRKVMRAEGLVEGEAVWVEIELL